MASIKLLKDYMDRVSELRIFRIIRGLDRHIARSLREERIHTRQSSSHGLWCCILLPTVLVLYWLQYRVSLLYSTVASISVGLLFYCLLFIIFMSVSCLVLKEHIYGGCLASSLVSTLLIYGILEQGFIFSVFYSILSVFSFSMLLRLSLTTFPNTFTIGEAMIVMQSITLFLISQIIRIIHDIGDKNDSEMNFVNGVNMVMFATVGLIIIALFTLQDSQKNVKHLYYLASISGTFALVMLHFVIGFDCIIRIARYIFLDVRKVLLFISWLSLSVLAGLVLMFRTQVAVKATTVTRKVFHILASLVFLTGIVYDVYLMTLAAGFGLAAMLLVEALRKSNIKDISPALEAAFQVYSDEKDAGYFAMTPIYLYAGLACPLVLVPQHKNDQLELLSGVLSVGVGDTAASWFGAKYGFNKWADGRKSLEGTVFNILSQVALVYGLEVMDVMSLPNGLIRTIVAASISGLVEAKTEQIDNLILPFFTIIAFQITWFLCSP